MFFIDPSAIAVDGVGFEPLAVATLGFIREAEAEAATGELARTTFRRGGSSAAKYDSSKIDQIIIMCKLIQINNKPAPPPDIKGVIKVSAEQRRGHATVVAEHLSTRTRAAWESIKVIVSRIK